MFPPWPDSATLEAMAWWAGAGGVLGGGGVLAAQLIAWIEERTSPYASPRSPHDRPAELPGLQPDDDGEKWRSPLAVVKFALLGTAAGAMLGWSLEQPEGTGSQMQLLAELFAVATAAFVLVRTMRDTPAVGEAPPDDPDQSVAVRVRNALFKLAAAGFMLAMVWLTLD